MPDIVTFSRYSVTDEIDIFYARPFLRCMQSAINKKLLSPELPFEFAILLFASPFTSGGEPNNPV